MSEEPLVSPEEMASVLAGGEPARAETPADAPDEAGVYSLRRPVAIAPDEEPEARRRIDSLVSQLASILARELETEVEITVQGFQQQRAVDAIESMPPPTWVVAFPMEEGGGLALVLDPVCALTLVELALGGRGNSQTTGREPTPLEARVMSNFGTALSAPLGREAGRVFLRSSLAIAKMPGELAAPGETVGAALLEMKLGGAERRALLLATAGLLRDPEAAAGTVADGRIGPMADRLARVAVEIRPVLDAGRIALRDLIDLKQDAVLTFESSEERPLELRVEGISMFRGRVRRGDGTSTFDVNWRRGRRESDTAGRGTLVGAKGEPR